MARNSPKFPKRKGAVCGSSFVPSSPRAMTCSRDCSLELNRTKTLDKARERAFLKPYSNSCHGFDGQSQEVTDCLNRTDSNQSVRDSSTACGKKKGDWIEKEPRSPSDRKRQLDEVERVMALPYSERYQFARHWSNFQRHAGLSIEKKRIADECDFSPYNFR